MRCRSTVPATSWALGDPLGIVDAVARGVDMFDCVLPTRLARHGTMLTSEGRLNLRNRRFATDDRSHRPGLRLLRLRPLVAGLPAPPAVGGRSRRRPGC